MLKKYLALLRASWQGTLEYRASILIYMLLASMPLVSLAVWLSLAADAPIGNYSSADFISYYLALIFARHMTGAWVSHELDYLIRQGLLSPLLLKPINPIHSQIAAHISDKLFRLPLVLTPIAIAALLIPGVHFDLSPLTILLFLLSLALTFAIIFVSTYCVGLLNFWITHAEAVSELWFGLRLLLGGTLAPIDLLPAPIPQLSVYLPFRYTLSFPVEIIIGRVSGGELALGFAVQLVWLAIFIALYRLLWVRGLRAYSAVGA